MIVRTLDSIIDGPLDVRAPTWRSRRLTTAADGLGFSLHDTLIHPGTSTVIEYRHHVEAVYCIEGSGSIRVLPDGPTFSIVPGTVYALDQHDRHELVAVETLRLVCVFTPALDGSETHGGDGAYPASTNRDKTPSADPYPTRGLASSLRPRLDPVLHGGFDAPGPLSRRELATFAENGFVSLRSAFAPSEIARLNLALETATNALDPKDPRVIREPDSDTVRSLFAFHELPGALQVLAFDTRLVDAARQILGSDVSIHQSRINHKSAGRGRAFAWHSDFETWHAEDGMPRMRAVSAVVALSPSTAENGPLRFMPGSHRTFVSCAGSTPKNHHEVSLRRQEYGIPHRAALASLEATHGVETWLAGPGDVVLFDCNLLHGSQQNDSSLARTSAFVVYDSVLNRPRLRPAGLESRPVHVASRGDEPPIPCPAGKA